MSVTLVHGTSFCISDDDGELDESAAQGVFYQDTRILSRWSLRVGGKPVQAVTAQRPEPFHARFVGLTYSQAAGVENTLLVHRDRYLGNGIREDIVLHNYGGAEVTCTVALRVRADFADVFEVKEGRVHGEGEHAVEVTGDGLSLTRHVGDGSRGVFITAEGAECSRDRLTFRVTVPANQQWRVSVHAQPCIDGEITESLFPGDSPVEQSVPGARSRRWREGGPTLRRAENKELAATLQRSWEDLGSLRIFDPANQNNVALAAGAPWFLTLFGRDSLLASLMSITIDPTLALGTVQTLADYQGTKIDDDSEEQPGKILHEVRFGADASLALGGKQIYYGTIDATQLFVMLMGELKRWGIGRANVAALMPNVERALNWIDQYSDPDGDGFSEYQRATEWGLVNQGWKDSWDGINFADGTIAHAPIALCEVQGYNYAAFLARADLADSFEDQESRRYWEDRAADLKIRFNEQFWMPELGRYAIGLDGDKRPIDAMASNIGHCLWTGIIDEDKAASVADSLMSPQMFSGWGIRTLATNMGAYNPMSYHNGSVWPHDNALIADGLMRYGFVEHAQRVAKSMMSAARSFDGRLPELMCGFDSTEYPKPIPYPTSCSPQAWASAAPVHLLRVLLRVAPSLPDQLLCIGPALPESFGELVIDNVPVGEGSAKIEAKGENVQVYDLPDGVELIRTSVPRP